MGTGRVRDFGLGGFGCGIGLDVTWEAGGGVGRGLVVGEAGFGVPPGRAGFGRDGVGCFDGDLGGGGGGGSGGG